ncbi:MAG: hypothetical protein KAT16_03055, partial [Candidatus Heimdallarchaeota archaeon]|nr:hypothetical protein [Candidatus Heimdallarchaeota archaeon]
MKKRNYMFIIVVQLLVLHSVSYSYSFNLLPAVDKIAEITSSNAIDNQVENGNFESGALSGWTLNSRIITDKYITGQSYEVNNDLPHTGYYSLYLYTHAVNQISGYRGGDLSVARNITYSEPLRDYNLTGYVYVNRCSSVHYENWAGVTISFFDSSLAELGRIYYQFAEYG